jgi:undecaprenyl-diphosphatase
MPLTVIQALILGIIQGLTEFVPVSSSAHLIIIPWLFNWNDPGLSFDVALHLGTLVSLLLFFWRDWVRLIKAGIASLIERKIADYQDRRLAWFLVIGTIPGILSGLFFENHIVELFHKPGIPNSSSSMAILAVVIAFTGLVLFFAERLVKHNRDITRISLKDALVIGFSQALSIFPGVSRSGSTITAGLAMGMEREAAARFSFLLAAPIVLGAGAKGLIEFYSNLQSGVAVQPELLVFVIGFISACISGFLCIKFLLRYLQSHSTNIFVYYRWILAAFIIIIVLI